jgi:hypothetical protein
MNNNNIETKNEEKNNENKNNKNEDENVNKNQLNFSQRNSRIISAFIDYSNKKNQSKENSPKSARDNNNINKDNNYRSDNKNYHSNKKSFGTQSMFRPNILKMLEKKNNELIEKGIEKEKEKNKALTIDTQNDLETNTLLFNKNVNLNKKKNSKILNTDSNIPVKIIDNKIDTENNNKSTKGNEKGKKDNKTDNSKRKQSKEFSFENKKNIEKKLENDKLKEYKRMASNRIDQILDDDDSQNYQINHIKPSTIEVMNQMNPFDSNQVYPDKKESLTLENNMNMMHFVHNTDDFSYKRFEFEPKELEDNVNRELPLSGRFRNNRYNSVFIPNSSKIPNKGLIDDLKQIEPFDKEYKEKKKNKKGNNNKMKIDDLQNENVNDNKLNDYLNIGENKKVIKLKNINELKQILQNINNNSISNSNNDSSIYYIIGGNDEELNNNNINESEDSNLRTSQIVKVKGNKMTDVTDRNILNLDNSTSKKISSNLSLDKNSSKSSSNTSSMYSSSELSHNILYSDIKMKNNVNNDDFPNKKNELNKINNSQKQNKNKITNKTKLNKKPVNQNIGKNKNDKVLKNYNMVKKVKNRSNKNIQNIQNNQNKNKTSSNRNIKEFKVLDEIKKEVKESNKPKENNLKDNLKPNTNSKSELKNSKKGFMKSQNQFQKINKVILFKKSNTKQGLKKPEISPKKNIKNNISNSQNENKSDYLTPTFNKNNNTSNKKTEKKFDSEIKGNNLENELLKAKLEEEESSYKLIREKYLEYLKTTFKGEEPKHTKEEDDINDNLLRSLVKNEIPIENENLDSLECTNDMKSFLLESINNFKLSQMKEKANQMHFNDSINKESKNNFIGLIQLDYGDDNDNSKDNANIFEPMELETGSNINLRKSFVKSFRRESAIFLPSVIEKTNAKKASLFK